MMQARIIRRPEGWYNVETRVWYWPFWTHRRMCYQGTTESEYRHDALAWAKYYTNPEITVMP